MILRIKWSFRIFKELRCPRLYPLPYMRLNCTGTRRGSECSFSCDDNSVLVGSRTTYCQRNGNLPYSKWTMDSHPVCESKWMCDTIFSDVYFPSDKNNDNVLSYVLKQNFKILFFITLRHYIPHIFDNRTNKIMSKDRY